KAGSSGRPGRRFTLRDVLLAGQIAICAILVTSSLVALRGLVRSLQSDLGFEPRNTMLVSTNLAMAGYSGEQLAEMQKRMIHALETIPGVERAGLGNNYPPLVYAAGSRPNVYKEGATDFKPASVTVRPYRYDVSPEYFPAAGTTLLAGRGVRLHQDKAAPPRAVGEP